MTTPNTFPAAQLMHLRNCFHGSPASPDLKHLLLFHSTSEYCGVQDSTSRSVCLPCFLGKHMPASLTLVSLLHEQRCLQKPSYTEEPS